MTNRDPRIEKIRHRLGYGWTLDELLLLMDAEIERLRADMRKAFTAGFWSWAGPTNDAEFKATEKAEEEAWREWTTGSNEQKAGD